MHSREQLAALLWGDSSDEKASASLRQALSSLRRVLGDEIQVERTRVSLAPGVRCDVRRFLELAPTDPAAAVAIEIPRFLEGFSPRHCPAFDDWVDAVRGDLIARYCRALASAGRDAMARRDWREAISLAERWIQAAPSSAEAAHLAVEALYLSGDTTGALAAHADFTDRRGGKSHPALQGLIEKITGTRERPEETDGNDNWHESTPNFEAGLAGRGVAWDALLQAWTEAEHGEGRVVVVEGEAGAGKTRLAEDFCRWITMRGGQVLRTQAYESGLATQLGIMLELLRDALHLPGVAGADPITLGVIARVLPDVRRRFPGIVVHDTDPGMAVLEEAVADLLLAIAEDQPSVVVVDDFHWCDPETSTVLHYLARRLERAPVLWYVALTWGHEEHDAPAMRVARAMRVLPGARRLELAPLTPDEVWEVLRDLGRIRSDQSGRRLAERLHEVTHGNPFYLIELLKTWLAEGWFSADPATGEWTLSDRGDVEVPVGTVSPSVHEAIARRVARLPDDQQSLLMTIAAHDHGCSTDVLSHVHGMSRLRISSLCGALEQRFLVSESGERYTCAHPIITSVVLTSIGPARRRELHRAIAIATVAAARGRGTSADPGEVALHADLGEEVDLAYAHAMRAAEAARSLGATGEALHWLDVAARWARSPDETAAVDGGTAALLDLAGGAITPHPPARRRSRLALSRQDFDLNDGPETPADAPAAQGG